MLVPLKGWTLTLLIIAVLAGGYYRAFERLPLPSSDDQRVRTELAERWAQKVSSEVRRLPGRPTVAVARVVNDDDGILTRELKRWIARRNVRMVNDRWYHDLEYKAGASAEPESMDDSCEPLVGKGVDNIIVAEISNWTTYPEFEATLVGCVEIRNGQTGETILQYQLSMPEIMEVVHRDPVTEGPSEPTPSPESASSGHSSLATNTTMETSGDELNRVAGLITRNDASLTSGSEVSWNASVFNGVAAWIVMVMAAPVVWSHPLRRILRHRNNMVNLTLLVAWVLAVSILAGGMWLWRLPVFTAAVSGMAAVLLATFYFAYCCQQVEEHM